MLLLIHVFYDLFVNELKNCLFLKRALAPSKVCHVKSLRSMMLLTSMLKKLWFQKINYNPKYVITT